MNCLIVFSSKDTSFFWKFVSQNRPSTLSDFRILKGISDNSGLRLLIAIKSYDKKNLSRLTSSRQTYALCRSLKSGGNFAPLPFLFPKNLASQSLSGALKSVYSKDLRSFRKLKQGRSLFAPTSAPYGHCPERPPQNFSILKRVHYNLYHTVCIITTAKAQSQ